MKYFNLDIVMMSNGNDVLHREYRRLCNVYHPDKSNGDSTMFNEMKEEYEELLIILKHRVALFYLLEHKIKSTMQQQSTKPAVQIKYVNVPVPIPVIKPIAMTNDQINNIIDKGLSFIDKGIEITSQIRQIRRKNQRLRKTKTEKSIQNAIKKRKK